MSNTESFESRAIVELMGHRARPGMVRNAASAADADGGRADGRGA